MKGCICLDIDGTLTADPMAISEETVNVLKELHKRGWEFLFITGRAYSFACRVLNVMDFPYYFSVQNGADLLLMPEKRLLAREYLSSSLIPKLELIAKNVSEGFLIYSGYEKGDFCYYNPAEFTQTMIKHLEVVRTMSNEPWVERESFIFKEEESFPLVKCLGTQEEMTELYKLLKHVPEVKSTCVKDPLADFIHLNLITSPSATKGTALEKVRSYMPEGTLFIAAGDDYNDISMLEKADIAIVMNTAPKIMIEMADIVAKSAKEQGLIKALLQATKEEI